MERDTLKYRHLDIEDTFCHPKYVLHLCTFQPLKSGHFFGAPRGPDSLVPRLPFQISIACSTGKASWKGSHGNEARVRIRGVPLCLLPHPTGSTYKNLVDVVESGYLSEETISQSVVKLMKDFIHLGVIDPPDLVPYNKCVCVCACTCVFGGGGGVVCVCVTNLAFFPGFPTFSYCKSASNWEQG